MGKKYPLSVMPANVIANAQCERTLIINLSSFFWDVECIYW